MSLRGLLLGPQEVLGHERGEVEVRLARLGPHHVEIDLGAGREVLVERHDDDTAAAGLEVLHDVLDLDHLAGLADPRDDGEERETRSAYPWAESQSRVVLALLAPSTDGVEMMIS